jgi:hypothetical protein
VVEDTGFRNVLPTGEGILAFSDLDEAVAAIQDVESRYRRHADAARELAEGYFDSGAVLSRLVDDAMATSPPRRVHTSGVASEEAAAWR